MSILGKIPLSSQIRTDPRQDLWEQPPHSRKHTLKRRSLVRIFYIHRRDITLRTPILSHHLIFFFYLFYKHTKTQVSRISQRQPKPTDHRNKRLRTQKAGTAYKLTKIRAIISETPGEHRRLLKPTPLARNARYTVARQPGRTSKKYAKNLLRIVQYLDLRWSHKTRPANETPASRSSM